MMVGFSPVGAHLGDTAPRKRFEVARARGRGQASHLVFGT